MNQRTLFADRLGSLKLPYNRQLGCAFLYFRAIINVW